jgi:hypothetical protein
MSPTDGAETILRTCASKWKRRYDEYGDAGLCDRPRTPHRCPHATQENNSIARLPKITSIATSSFPGDGASRSGAVTQPVCRLFSMRISSANLLICAALTPGHLSGHVSASAVTAMSGRSGKRENNLFARHFSTARRVL